MLAQPTPATSRVVAGTSSFLGSILRGLRNYCLVIYSFTACDFSKWKHQLYDREALVDCVSGYYGKPVFGKLHRLRENTEEFPPNAVGGLWLSIWGRRVCKSKLNRSRWACLSLLLIFSSEIPHYKKRAFKPSDCVRWVCLLI